MYQVFRRREASDELDDNVGIGRENGVEVVGPNYVVRNPGLLLALEVAIADVSEAEQAVAVIVFSCAENFGNGAADSSEAHEGDAARGRAIP